MTTQPSTPTAGRGKRQRQPFADDDRGLALRIGGRLRQARHAAGLTQSQLAAGRYTKAYVSALETGASKPSMAALNFFADRLGVQASRFLDDEPSSWRRLEVDLDLASARWQAAADGYGELLELAPSREVRAELLRGLSEAMAGLDRGPEGSAAGAEAAQIFDSLGRDADAAIARYWLAAGEHAQGNSVEAESIIRAILARVRGGLRVEPDFELRLVMALSTTASRAGRHDVALAYLEEVRGLADSLDDHRRGTYLYDLAYSYRETGDFEAAVRAGIASLTLFRATSFELGTASLENDLALSFLALGNIARATEFAASSQARFEKLGDRRQLAHVLETRAQIALSNDDPAGSLEVASAALAVAEETHNEKATVNSLLSVGRAHRVLGQPAKASPFYERAVALARSSASPGLIRGALGEWADVLSEAGEHERAAALLREALRAT